MDSLPARLGFITAQQRAPVLVHSTDLRGLLLERGLEDLGFLPDGRAVAVLSQNGAVAVFEVASATELARIPRKEVVWARIPGDGSWLATWTAIEGSRPPPDRRANSYDPMATPTEIGRPKPTDQLQVLETWDLPSGSLRAGRFSAAPEFPVEDWSWSWSRNGSLFYVPAQRALVRNWGDGAVTFEAAEEAPFSRATFSPDARSLLIGRPGGVAAWDLASRRALFDVKLEGTPIVLLAQKDHSVVAGFYDGRLQGVSQFGWPRSSTLFAMRHLHSGPIWSLRLHELPEDDGPYGSQALLVSSSWDRSLVVWRGSLALARLPGSAGGQVALSNDGKRLLLASSENELALWDISSVRRVEEVVAPSLENNPGNHWSVSAGGRRLVGSGDERLPFRVIDLQSGRVVASLWGRAEGRGNASLSADGTRVAILGQQGAEVFELTGGGSRRLGTFGQAALPIALSPDGAAVVGRQDAGIAAWNVGSGLLLWSRAIDATAAAVSANGQVVALGTATGEIHVLALADGKTLAVLHAGRSRVHSLAVASDSSLIAAVARGGTWLFDRATGDTHRLEESRVAVHGGLAFSPDGAVLAAAGSEWVTGWDAKTGEEVFRLPSEGFSVGFTDAETLVHGSRRVIREHLGVGGLPPPAQALEDALVRYNLRLDRLQFSSRGAGPARLQEAPKGPHP